MIINKNVRIIPISVRFKDYMHHRPSSIALCLQIY